ncbi:nucleotide-binding protein [Clostridioides sp. ZZV14-6150]|uniref:TIR domain-containing protein n=1 Tax=unclassified Clostridioides TaxID=2635829 RepID=UPI001D1160EE|nr:nucleotide-binding protein [Clostridioides sp. ZZV14-6150]MCC0722681.1 nucleotide-binding protein [Clostridioides sp. ZZV14-6104]
MYYHVFIRINKKFKSVMQDEHINLYEVDIDSKEILLRNIVQPFVEDDEIILKGCKISSTKINDIIIKITDKTSEEIINDYSLDDEFGKSIIDVEDFIEAYPGTKDVAATIIAEAKEYTHKNKPILSLDKTKVFIVHGHDNLAKIEVARFIEKIGFEAIILHEQANKGKTIIEKIEENTNVGFAIVLYTPCDVGGKEGNLKARARQNVVFEHGFLMGKIGRSNVCALVKDNIETPNDISGVVYVAMDSEGAWERKLLKEMQASGYEIDLSLLFK